MHIEWKISLPVPLKHHTETAYLIILGLLICVSAFLASLLPDLPEGLKYCLLFFTVFALYPIFLIPTFKRNRVDYEFRLLHWFPAGAFALWLLLQLSAPYWKWFNVVKLGFLFLWGLPIVALGLGCIVLFALHVIRRRTVRIAVLSTLFVLFTAGSLMAEAKAWNNRLQANIFETMSASILRPSLKGMRSVLAMVRMPQQETELVSEKTIVSVPSSSVLSTGKKHQVRSSLHSSFIVDHMPKRLPQSGPELVFALAATLLALYAGTLHARQRNEAE